MCIVNSLVRFCSATAQRIFAIKIRRTTTQTAVSQDYLLAGVPSARFLFIKKEVLLGLLLLAGETRLVKAQSG